MALPQATTLCCCPLSIGWPETLPSPPTTPGRTASATRLPPRSAVSYTDPNDRRFDRGNCGGIDVRHVINISGVMQSPKYSNRMVEAIAGNWQLAPIVGWHSGNAFTVSTGVDNALNNVGGQRPNLVGNPYCAIMSASCTSIPLPSRLPQQGPSAISARTASLGLRISRWISACRAGSLCTSVTRLSSARTSSTRRTA